MPFSQFVASFFAEYEWKLTHKLLLKPGLRYEYAAQNMEQNVQARIAIAYKTSRYTQVSFAGGSFRQLQADDYVKFNATLKSAQAAQYIVNFQYEKNGRLFRMESYYKQYRSLISYEYLNSPKPESYTTDGKGFARGIDLFYRDTESIKNGDFWVSYAYVDAKRRYKDYPVSTQADYLSPHTFALVYKQYFNIVHTQFGFSYNYSSGKKYNNPNESQFMSGRLAGIHDLSFSFSYLTTIFGQQAILHGSVSNLLGFDYLYGYRFASRANDDGIFRSRPIEPMAKRMLFCGLFINM
jgi:outer membrane receptor for ferrienterochelin and colicin